MPEFPEKLYAVGHDEHRDWDHSLYRGPLTLNKDGLERPYTLSSAPDCAGWDTDGGHEGYGPSKEIAQEIARRYNAEPLLVEALRKIAAIDPWDRDYGTPVRIAQEALAAYDKSV